MSDSPRPQLCDVHGCIRIARQCLAVAGGAFVCDEHCEQVNNTVTQATPVTVDECDLGLALIRVAEARSSLQH